VDDALVDTEVVDAEIVEEDRLPATLTDPGIILGGALARPVLTQHTVLRPGELPTTESPPTAPRSSTSPRRPPA
jgi:hypothetical protein